MKITLLLALAATASATEPAAPPFAVSIRVDAARSLGAMQPLWAFFGYDEPNYTYRPDGRKLLSQLAAASPGPVHVRMHNLLTSGDGTPALKWGSTGVYTEDAAGRPHYDWTIMDRIFDTLHDRGIKPFAQIGFMPEALSTNPEPYQHSWKPGDPYGKILTGWAYPPKDYAKWGELVYQWVRHSVARYGQAEVESWHWEVWNEPDGYLKAPAEDYFKIYDYAADAVKRALPTARVGGPHTTGPHGARGGKYLRDFLEHCLHGTNYATGKIGSPLDFVAFHAKGAPKFVDGHVQTGLGALLGNLDSGFTIVTSFPELKHIPVFIGESDPDGCAACSALLYPANGYRNTALFASHTAASLARHYALADQYGVNLQGAVTWSFEFEGQPWFAGFRALATNGVPLPVLNVFRMLGRMGQDARVAAESTGDAGAAAIIKNGVRADADVAALASRDAHSLAVLVWHHHDDDVPGPTAAVELALAGLPAGVTSARLEHWRIDLDHSNAYTVWQAMGSPPHPTPEQIARLEQASELTALAPPSDLRMENGAARISFTLPRQAVSLVVLRW